MGWGRVSSGLFVFLRLYKSYTIHFDLYTPQFYIYAI